MSQPSRPHRGGRDRNNDPRDKRVRRDHHNGRPPSSDRPPSQRPYNPRSSTTSSRQTRDVPREEPHKSKCSYICSRRGIVLICTVLTNALVLICVVAAAMVVSGMSSMGGLAGGSFDINSAYSPFEGTELQQVRDLDMQYSQMRSPGIYGGVAFSLVLGVLSLLFVVAGNKAAHLLSPRLLVGQFFFQLLGAVAYVVAVGLYLHFIKQVNATDVCKQRARLYARQGYNWMNCDVSGADAAVALFGLITGILYGVGCFLTGRIIHKVRRWRQGVERDQAEGRSHHHHHQPTNHHQPTTHATAPLKHQALDV